VLASPARCGPSPSGTLVASPPHTGEPWSGPSGPLLIAGINAVLREASPVTAIGHVVQPVVRRDVDSGLGRSASVQELRPRRQLAATTGRLPQNHHIELARLHVRQEPLVLRPVLRGEPRGRSPGSAYRSAIVQPCRSHSSRLALFCSSMLRARWTSRRSLALASLDTRS
jgi:hypothetical protein